MTYRRLHRWKYQLLADCTFRVPRSWPASSIPGVLRIAAGRLSVLSDYAWDGVTGAPDLAFLLRASVAHDALYQLIRTGKLGRRSRRAADRLFYEIALEDAAAWQRPVVWLAYLAVRWFGWLAARSR